MDASLADVLYPDPIFRLMIMQHGHAKSRLLGRGPESQATAIGGVPLTTHLFKGYAKRSVIRIDLPIVLHRYARGLVSVVSI